MSFQRHTSGMQVRNFTCRRYLLGPDLLSGGLVIQTRSWYDSIYYFMLFVFLIICLLILFINLFFLPFSYFCTIHFLSILIFLHFPLSFLYAFSFFGNFTFLYIPSFVLNVLTCTIVDLRFQVKPEIHLILFVTGAVDLNIFSLYVCFRTQTRPCKW
jgi:hypothetical protein